MSSVGGFFSNNTVVGSALLHRCRSTVCFIRNIPQGRILAFSSRMAVEERQKGQPTSSLGFHHDHYDPEDLNHSLLDAVLEGNQDEIWVFGFGSLLHTPGFEYEDTQRGYIRGWKRVWWQGSTDHRGTERFPGRTVTLVEDAESVTYGVAYKLAGDMDQQRETLQYLEWREKQYDRREYVTLYYSPVIRGARPVLENALCYIATDDTEKNPNYLGPASLHEIATQVSKAVGPSGPNSEYLFKMEAVLKEHGAEESDMELMQLAEEVRLLLQNNE